MIRRRSGKYTSIETGIAAGNVIPIETPPAEHVIPIETFPAEHVRPIETPPAGSSLPLHSATPFKQDGERPHVASPFSSETPFEWNPRDSLERRVRDLVTLCAAVSHYVPHSSEHRHRCRQAVLAAQAFRDGPRIFVSVVKEIVKEARESLDFNAILTLVSALLDEVFVSGTLPLKLKVGGRDLMRVLVGLALQTTSKPIRELLVTSIFSWIKLVANDIDLFPGLLEASTQLKAADLCLGSLTVSDLAALDQVGEEMPVELTDRLSSIAQQVKTAMALLHGANGNPCPRSSHDLIASPDLQHVLAKLKNEAEFVRTKIHSTTNSGKILKALLDANEKILQAFESYNCALKELPAVASDERQRRSRVIMRTERMERAAQPQEPPATLSERTVEKTSRGKVKSIPPVGGLSRRLGRVSITEMASLTGLMSGTAVQQQPLDVQVHRTEVHARRERQDEKQPVGLKKRETKHKKTRRRHSDSSCHDIVPNLTAPYAPPALPLPTGATTPHQQLIQRTAPASIRQEIGTTSRMVVAMDPTRMRSQATPLVTDVRSSLPQGMVQSRQPVVHSSSPLNSYHYRSPSRLFSMPAIPSAGPSASATQLLRGNSSGSSPTTLTPSPFSFPLGPTQSHYPVKAIPMNSVPSRLSPSSFNNPYSPNTAIWKSMWK